MRACLGGQAALEIFTVVIAYEVDELLVRVDVEFCIGVFRMGTNGVLRDKERFGNVILAASLSDERGNFGFSVGKPEGSLEPLLDSFLGCCFVDGIAVSSGVEVGRGSGRAAVHGLPVLVVECVGGFLAG